MRTAPSVRVVATATGLTCFTYSGSSFVQEATVMTGEGYGFLLGMPYWELWAGAWFNVRTSYGVLVNSSALSDSMKALDLSASY